MILTPRQQACLLHLRGQLAVTGTVPTCREFARLLARRVARRRHPKPLTMQAIYDILVALEQRGYIARERVGHFGKSRALRLTPAGLAYPDEASGYFEVVKPPDHRRTRSIP